MKKIMCKNFGRYKIWALAQLWAYKIWASIFVPNFVTPKIFVVNVFPQQPKIAARPNVKEKIKRKQVIHNSTFFFYFMTLFVV